MDSWPTRWQGYWKAGATFLGALSVWGVTAYTTGQQITGDEWWGLLGVVGATMLTIIAPRNEPT